MKAILCSDQFLLSGECNPCMYLAMAKAGTIYVINDDAYFIQDKVQTTYSKNRLYCIRSYSNNFGNYNLIILDHLNSLKQYEVV